MLKEITNVDIDQYLEDYPQYGGCYSCRELPKVLLNRLYVVNLDTRKGGDGTHWTLIDNCSTRQKCIYFDPFGLLPNTYTQRFMQQCLDKKEMMYSDTDYQNMKTYSCGYFCVYVAEQICLGRQFSDILKDFTKRTMNNEHFLDEYFKH